MDMKYVFECFDKCLRRCDMASNIFISLIVYLQTF
jgi:hypothetical protein